VSDEVEGPRGIATPPIPYQNNRTLEQQGAKPLPLIGTQPPQPRAAGTAGSDQ
jgi:hypothetical protein